MKKIFIFAFAVVIFAACNPIPNKSITQKLETKELAKAIEKEPMFESCYGTVQNEFIPKINSEIELAKYVDVTYRRLYDYMKYVNDAKNIEPITKKAIKEWEDNYGSKKYDLETIITNYRQHLEFEKKLNDPYLVSQVPACVRYYIEYEDENPGKDNIYKGDVIREFIDKEYIDSPKAMTNAIFKFMKDKDEKCFRVLMISSGINPDEI